MITRLKYEKRLATYPPILVRLCTTRHGSDAELVEGSGLTIAEWKGIEYRTSWRGVGVPEHFAFLKACGIDLENRRTYRRLEWMRKNGSFRHLHTSELWEPQFREMVEIYLESIERTEHTAKHGEDEALARRIVALFPFTHPGYEPNICPPIEQAETYTGLVQSLLATATT
jgi:hypothetical protein